MVMAAATIDVLRFESIMNRLMLINRQNVKYVAKIHKNNEKAHVRGKQKSIDFQKDEKCTEVIQNNFDNVLIENGMILNIESLETPEDWSEFICIYVNDEMSQVGIEDIVLEDGMKISFVMTEYEY